MKLRTAVRTILVTAAVGLLAHPAPGAAAQEVVYLKYNVHLQCKADRRGNMVCEGSYANWTDPGHGHFVIPMNTRVSADKSGGKARGRSSFKMIVQDPVAIKLPSGSVVIEFDGRRMGMDMGQYIDLITSPTPVPVQQFSGKDQEGIKAGRALEGMTKQGVMAALGYPAAHETPSLESDSYFYWRNRMMKRRVDFNDKGLVVNVK